MRTTRARSSARNAPRRWPRACAKCGRPLSPTTKFCPECAHPTGLSAAPRFDSPESCTPRHLVEKILTSRSALEGERKLVTVLFADLKGSMERSADRDPEAARKLLDPVRQAVRRGGAPDRGRAAPHPGWRELGRVVVRSIGSDLHMDYTAVGQTTHPARLEQMAMPGSILIASETLQLAEGDGTARSGRLAPRQLPPPGRAFTRTGGAGGPTLVGRSSRSRPGGRASRHDRPDQELGAYGRASSTARRAFTRP
jgi:hypothetical protein